MTIPRTLPTTLCLAALASAAPLVVPARASAQVATARLVAAPAAPPPVTLTVTPRADTLRWYFTLENTSSAPVDVVTDRRMLWLEVVPAAAPAALPAGRRRARARGPVRCNGVFRPTSAEESPRATLAPGARYVEGFDLRDLCGLRLPAAVVPGAALVFRYGPRGRPAFSRAVVRDGRDPPIAELASAQVVVPATSHGAAWPPAGGAAERGDPRLRVTARVTPRAASIHGVRGTARVTLAQPYPLRVFFRVGTVRFELVGPDGRRVACRTGVRGYSPMREFFVRLARGQSVGDTYQLGLMCPPEQLDLPGTYRGQAIYESNLDGQEYGYSAFTGAAASDWFDLQLTRAPRGARYVILPAEDPFAAAPR